jgi:hypothetical protein
VLFTIGFPVQTEHPSRAILCTSCHCGCRGQVPYVLFRATCSTTLPIWLWTIRNPPARDREKESCGTQWFNPTSGTEVHSGCCFSTRHPKGCTSTKLTSVVSSLFCISSFSEYIGRYCMYCLLVSLIQTYNCMIIFKHTVWKKYKEHD